MQSLWILDRYINHILAHLSSRCKLLKEFQVVLRFWLYFASRWSVVKVQRWVKTDPECPWRQHEPEERERERVNRLREKTTVFRVFCLCLKPKRRTDMVYEKRVKTQWIKAANHTGFCSQREELQHPSCLAVVRSIEEQETKPHSLHWCSELF